MTTEPVDAHRTIETRPAEIPYARNGAPARSRWWVWLILLMIVGVAAWFLVPRFLHRNDAKGKDAGAGGRAVPVVIAAASKGELPQYLVGLGTVTPLNTVTVRSRVDGQIVKVYYTEGQTVKKDDPLVDIDPRPYQVQKEQAEGQLARDKANLENAKKDLERFQYLIKTNSINQQQLDTQQSMVTQLGGAITSDQAQVDNAKLQLVYCHITAPISGRIGLRQVDEGNMVHANDNGGLAVIAQVQPITVVFTISEDEISRVLERPDHGDGLPVAALNRDRTRTLNQGKLSALDNQVDPTTGTVRLKAMFDNQDNVLFPNQFVNARLLVDTLKDVVLVPTAAVQFGPNEMTFVYVVKADQTVDLRNVTAGAIEGERQVIEKGLSPGEKVVIEGIDKLQPGTKVSFRPPTTSKGKSATQPAGNVAQPPPAVFDRRSKSSRPSAGTQPGAAVPQATQPGAAVLHE